DSHKTADIAAMRDGAECLAQEGAAVEKIKRKKGNTGGADDQKLLRQNRNRTEKHRLLAEEGRNRRGIASPENLSEVDQQETNGERTHYPNVAAGPQKRIDRKPLGNKTEREQQGKYDRQHEQRV